MRQGRSRVRHEELFERLGVELTAGELSDEERALIDRSYDTEYARPEWTFPPCQTHTSVLSAKAQSGVFTPVADLDGNRLGHVDVCGDLLIPRQNDLRDLTKAMRGRTLGEPRALVRASSLPEDLRSALLGVLTVLQMTDERDR